MARDSRIEWTEVTWNPVVGCAKVSEGCRHCYAETMSRRLAGMARADLAAGRNPSRKMHYLEVIDARRGSWNGKVALVPESLDDPHRWREPCTVFVNSMSDLFHPGVPLDYVKRVFAVMNECPRHTFQVLTKRPEYAAEVASLLEWSDNIWIGTSVESMLVSHRVRDLVKIRQAHVRFLSVEPLLGPIPRLALRGIEWVIVGGESGPGARPMETAWVRQIRDRCVAQGVAFFFKQWGGVNKKAAGRSLDGREWNEMPERVIGRCTKSDPFKHAKIDVGSPSSPCTQVA